MRNESGLDGDLAARPLPSRRALIACACAAVALLLACASAMPFVDPDLWHQMSLAREIVRVHAMPRGDVFAYTPTLPRVLQHEWGAGMLWLAVATATGSVGFLVFRNLLVAALAWLTVRAARRRGADVWTTVLLALPAIGLARLGFTTIRAQLLSMVALAVLMNVFAEDDAGNRRWLAPWLLVQIVWLNVHAGFVVGVGFLGITTIERAIRREPFVHLAALTVASAALVLVNPYGTDYVSYLVRGLTMARPMVTEWRPLWGDVPRTDVALWLLAAGLAAYGVASRGPRSCRGWPVVAVALFEGLAHDRHLQLLAVVWLAIVPVWLAPTLLLDRVRAWIAHRERAVLVLGGLASVVWLTSAAIDRPWQLHMPTSADEASQGMPAYPVGATAYLQRTAFRGRLMTPFVQGGYVMWRLHPQGVLVSFDGRYEVAYPPVVGEGHARFYEAARGWQAVLRAWPADAVLVPAYTPVMQPMLRDPDWRVAYGDDVFLVFVPRGSRLPFEDHRHEVFQGTLP